MVGCGAVVPGTPTWPGAVLHKMLLTQADFPAGVQFDRIREDPGAPDGAGGPPSNSALRYAEGVCGCFGVDRAAAGTAPKHGL